MKSTRNYLPSNLRINPKYHHAIAFGAKVMKGIALLVFLAPFFLRFYQEATINSFFISFFSCLGVSIFLMMLAEILEATIDKEIQV